jgi:ATP/maltotriose-dependent transcriptional regulator MalT
MAILNTAVPLARTRAGVDAMTDVPEKLTARESQVLELIASGCTYSQTAERLGISLHTVTTHIKNLYRKLGVHCAAGAVMRAVRLRLLGERPACAPSSTT